MNDKVSIIIPMYNAEKSARRCLESALGQTYKNIEVICVDDGLTDQTSKIIELYSKRDSRIILVNKKNGGVSSARNAGMEKATGYYIQFLDVDDALEPNATARMVKMMTSNNLDIVMCGYHDVNKYMEKSLPEEIIDIGKLAEKFVPLYEQRT